MANPELVAATHLCVVNRRTGVVLAERARVANTVWLRGVGLLGSKNAGGGLFITPCSSIHTAFMGFAIDALFLNEQNEVLATYCPLVPWRMTRWVRGARGVLELDATRAGDTQRGDVLEAIPCA